MGISFIRCWRIEDGVVVIEFGYRIPGTSCLVWAVILCEREGLSLLFVQRPDHNQSHSLIIATENVEHRFFEPANAPT